MAENAIDLGTAGVDEDFRETTSGVDLATVRIVTVSRDRLDLESCGAILVFETTDAKWRCLVAGEPHQNEVVLPDENLALRAKIDAADSDCAPEKSSRKNLVHQGEYAAIIPLGAYPV